MDSRRLPLAGTSSSRGLPSWRVRPPNLKDPDLDINVLHHRRQFFDSAISLLANNTPSNHNYYFQSCAWYWFSFAEAAMKRLHEQETKNNTPQSLCIVTSSSSSSISISPSDSAPILPEQTTTQPFSIVTSASSSISVSPDLNFGDSDIPDPRPEKVESLEKRVENMEALVYNLINLNPVTTAAILDKSSTPTPSSISKQSIRSPPHNSPLVSPCRLCELEH
ncbi:hypothetical protein B0T21DRAFT_344330 [Apiosordaria backusii]|uniref:Uncharacterized protein n=1 Tax=Apiosordaria backusii TaxID=314023 RepID=A0AA40F098_9PEZI|nr:hypothetical protein B0T21DRAFT_344330 [Apiosordaria backusii]